MLHLHRSAVSLFAQKLIIPVSTTSCRSDLSKDAGSDHRQNVDEQWLELCAECGLSGFFRDKRPAADEQVVARGVRGLVGFLLCNGLED